MSFFMFKEIKEQTLDNLLSAYDVLLWFISLNPPNISWRYFMSTLQVGEHKS